MLRPDNATDFPAALQGASLPPGTIDYAFYEARAKALRSAAMLEAVQWLARALRRALGQRARSAGAGGGAAA